MTLEARPILVLYEPAVVQLLEEWVSLAAI